MKIALFVLALACALLSPLSSCLGPKVDQLALFDPARSSWAYVREDLVVGIADGQAAGELTQEAADTLRFESVKLGAALKAGDRTALQAVQWPTLRPWADRGIDAKLERLEIGPGVAESFHEHVRNFDDAVQRLRGAN